MLLGFSIVLVLGSVIAWRGIMWGRVPLSLTRVVEGPAARAGQRVPARGDWDGGGADLGQRRVMKVQ